MISESQHTEFEDDNDTLESCDGDEDFEMPNKDQLKEAEDPLTQKSTEQVPLSQKAHNLRYKPK